MKLNQNFVSKTMGSNFVNTDNRVKVNRHRVAITVSNGIVLLTDGKDIKDIYMTEEGKNITDTCLEALIAFLETVPDNTEECIAVPHRVILPGALGGLASGSFMDWYRTKKTVGSKNSPSKDIPAERIENYAKVLNLVSSKFVNVELIDDNYKSKEDSTFVDPFWKEVKGISLQAVKDTMNGSVAPVQAPKASELSDEDKAKIEQLKAEISALEDELDDTDDEEVEAKLEKKITKKMSRIARIKAMAGQEEVSEEKQAVESDDVANKIEW